MALCNTMPLLLFMLFPIMRIKSLFYKSGRHPETAGWRVYCAIIEYYRFVYKLRYLPLIFPLFGASWSYVSHITLCESLGCANDAEYEGAVKQSGRSLLKAILYKLLQTLVSSLLQSQHGLNHGMATKNGHKDNVLPECLTACSNN
ncbi:hypothetical protein ACFE04_021702 [Oxalis oulophora]